MRKLILLTFFLLVSGVLAEPVSTVEGLIKAVTNGQAGDQIEIAEGTYELKAPLSPKANMVIKGAGIGKTIIKSAASWKPGTRGLPKKDNPKAYLFSFEKANGLKMSEMTMIAPTLHGAIWGKASENVELFNLHIEKCLWSGIRTFNMKQFKVHDCSFHDAGGTVKFRGGAMYVHWTKNSEFWNNRITRSENHPKFFGIKGRGITNSRVHHNTIMVNFSIEFPFENDKNVEIDHNYLAGAVSLPKFGGGMKIEEGQRSFRVHHNYINKSYAIELARNAMEVDHNLFVFSTSDDKGNLLCNFGDAKVPGPLMFHNNLVMNPGRGVLWTKGPHAKISIYNNHIKANTLTRKDGLFGFHTKSDFTDIVIKDNIIECIESNPRKLMRNDESYSATVENNQLVNVPDADKSKASETERKVGPLEPLKFKCGVNGEYSVNQWEITKAEM